jgi:hypothetical protein
MLKAMCKNWVFVILMLVALTPAPARSQENHFALAFVSNINEAPIGAGLYWVRSGKVSVGAYADVKFSRTQISRLDSYHGNVTLKDAEVIYGDAQIGEAKSILMANVGLTHKTSDGVAVYAGVGYTWESSYKQFYDPYEILGDSGQYYVEDPGASNNRLNINGGMLITAGHWAALIGYDTSPGSLNLGLGIYF